MGLAINTRVDWNWLINSDTERLELKLSDDIVFETPFKPRELNGLCYDGACFTTSDAFVYSLHRDKFSSLPITEEHAFVLAICATVASHYLSPLAIRSWHFHRANNDLSRPVQQGDWAVLNAKNEAIYLVINVEETASDVLLISSSHQIDEQRTFHRGKALRVHNDRLTPVLYKLQEHQL